MVVAAERAYSDAKRWMRSARPRRIQRNRFAWRSFGGFFVAGIVVLGVISLIAPNSFGAPGTNTLGTGWPLMAILSLIAASLLYAFVRRRSLAWLLTRIRDPYRRRMNDHPSFDGAADALAECPNPYRTRFALNYVWIPIGLTVLGATFAFSVAYFVIDAVGARFMVGWGQAVYAAVFVALSVLTLAVAAGRLSTWRLATSVLKEVNTGYV